MNVPKSLVSLVSSLLVSVDNHFLVDQESLPFADVFNENFGRVLRQDVSDSVVFQLLLSARDEEWILFIDQKAVEHELRVGHALALQAYTLVELEGSDKRDQSLEQEVVCAILTLF